MAMLPYDINTNETYQDILLACTAFIDVSHRQTANVPGLL